MANEKIDVKAEAYKLSMEYNSTPLGKSMLAIDIENLAIRVRAKAIREAVKKISAVMQPLLDEAYDVGVREYQALDVASKRLKAQLAALEAEVQDEDAG